MGKPAETDRPHLKSLSHSFTLDFVIFCESKEEAERGYRLCEQVLKSLKLAIHPLEPQPSKTKIGWFPKEDLLFLGLRFESKYVFAAKKSKDRFVAKIGEILN